MSEAPLPKSPSWLGWLKSIDMFGAPIQLHIHKQTEYKTIFSGLLSLVVVFAVVASALTMIIDALYYANINFLTTFSFSDNKILPLNSTNFVMSLRVNDPTFSASKSFYSINFQHLRNSGSIVESLGTMQCTKDYLHLHARELEGVDISKMLCPAGSLYNIESKDAQYLQISVKKCENTTKSSVVCAPQSEIDDYFSDPKNIKPVSVSLFLTNHVLDMLTPEPNILYLKELGFKMPGGMIGRQSDLSIYEEVVRVENSVMNTFKRGIEEDNSFTLEERIVDHIVYAADGTFLEINIKKSELEKKYVRSFTKIEEILAFLGGLSKALVIIVSAVAIPFNSFHYRLAISNEIYEFESRPKIYYQKTAKGQAWRKSSKTFSNLDNFSANKDDPIEEGNLAFNRRLIHNEKVQQYHPFFESLLMRHHRLDYTIRELLKNIFCCKRRNLMIKHDLYRQAQERLRKDIDVITILKKLQDVDKLKELLLNKDQLELFNYKKPLRIEYLGRLNLINKIPLITKRKRPSDAGAKEENGPRRSLYLHDRPLDTVEHFKTLFEAYKVVSKDRSSRFNTRLGEMLGPDLLKIFEKLDSDFQSDMATITRKSSQLNKVDLDAVIGRHMKEDPIKSERSNSDDQPHTFRVMSDEKLRVPKLYKSATAADDLEEVRKQEDNIHINVTDPKFPMKESQMIEKSRKSGLSVISSQNVIDIHGFGIGGLNVSQNL